MALTQSITQFRFVLNVMLKFIVTMISTLEGENFDQRNFNCIKSSG